MNTSTKLKYSAYAGFITAIFTVPTFYVEFLKATTQQELSYLSILLIILNLPFYIYHIYGLKIIGSRYKSDLINKGSVIFITTGIVVSLIVISNEFGAFAGNIYIPALLSTITFIVAGIGGILSGLGLRKLVPQLGGLANVMAILEIVLGIANISVIFLFVSVILGPFAAVVLSVLQLRLSKKIS